MQEKLHDKGYAAELIAKAEEDLEAANVLQKSKKDVFATAAFHAQQCVEKSIKAVLVASEIPFAYVHDLGVFVEKIPDSVEPPPFKYELIELNEYSVLRRYREGPTPVTKSESAAAIAKAKAIFKWATNIVSD